MTPTKRVLDVGQCVMDGPRLGRLLTRQFHCTVDRAHNKTEALAFAAANSYDLVLVNRLLDRDRSPGIDVIAALHEAYPALTLMLVSDIAPAQQEAIKAGARPGFGKSSLDSPQTEALLNSILGDHAKTE